MEWFETLKKMNKAANKDDRYPFIHARSQLGEALKGNTELTGAFKITLGRV